MSKKLILKRTYAEIVKGTERNEDEQQNPEVERRNGKSTVIPSSPSTLSPLKKLRRSPRFSPIVYISSDSDGSPEKLQRGTATRRLAFSESESDSIEISDEDRLPTLAKPKRKAENKRKENTDISKELQDKGDKLELFRGKWPVYEKRIKGFTALEAAEILLSASSEYICDSVPKQVMTTATFIIDVKKLNNYKDLTVDDNGIFNRPSGNTVFLTRSMENPEILKITNNKNESYHYILKRNYYRHSTVPEFHKITYVLKTGKSQNSHAFALCQYYFEDGIDKEITCKPHGNIKDRHNVEPYFRTKPSTLDQIREKRKYLPPKKVDALLLEECGGAEGIESASDIARDKHQIYNATKKSDRLIVTKGGAHKKTYFQKLIQMSVKGDYVRSFEVNKDGHPRAYMASDQQLLDLKRFCCKDTTAILGIDPTFKLGQFYLTCTTFRHPLFVDKYNGKNVLVPGPFLMHATRNESDYEYFGVSLTSSLESKRLKAWSSDGEVALIKGIKKGESFQSPSIHLRCMSHAKDNCDNKLKKLNVGEAGRTTLLQSIFGMEKSDGDRRTRLAGMIDSENEVVFDLRLDMAKEEWDKIERKATGNSPVFWQYFKQNLAKDIKESMLKGIRIAAGLGNPPAKFTSNDNECYNSIIKRNVQWEKKTWDQMATELQTMADEIQLEMQKAVYSLGQYRLAPAFQHLTIETSKWMTMSRDQRKLHLRKVFKSPIQVLDPYEITMDSVPSLSISIVESQLSGFRPSELQEVWINASNLLAQEGSIVKFPVGHKYCCMENENVFSVSVSSANDYRCTKCKEFGQFKFFCRHTLAVSEKEGNLAAHIEKVNFDNEKQSMNSILQQTCSYAGEKKIKRKGKNNTRSLPVDRVMPFQSAMFTEPYHNDDNFYLIFLQDYAHSKCCASCNIDFPKSCLIAPHDVAVMHNERYRYPLTKDGKTTWEYTRSKMRAVFYHAQNECIMKRHPYFETTRLQIENDVKSKLRDVHQNMLKLHFDLAV